MHKRVLGFNILCINTSYFLYEQTDCHTQKYGKRQITTSASLQFACHDDILLFLVVNAKKLYMLVRQSFNDGILVWLVHARILDGMNLFTAVLPPSLRPLLRSSKSEVGSVSLMV